MAGTDLPHDPAKALKYKDEGNACFQSKDYLGAEKLYTKAINHDHTNPLLYTNRAMAVLKLSNPHLPNHCHQIISDSLTSIRLLPENMKAYFFLAQAQIALHDEAAALESSKTAHRLCVEECRKVPIGKGSSSIRPITDLVLQCKREWWERRELERLQARGGLLEELIGDLELKREVEIRRTAEAGAAEGKSGSAINEDCREVEETFGGRIDEVRRTFEQAGNMREEQRKRKVPDWCIDDITFSVMLDPVVTKTGQSYDRSSLMEHLKRSKTDPLTREPLQIEDLRPNLALKEACANFLEENGWAVDW